MIKFDFEVAPRIITSLKSRLSATSSLVFLRPSSGSFKNDEMLIPSEPGMGLLEQPEIDQEQSCMPGFGLVSVLHAIRWLSQRCRYVSDWTWLKFKRFSQVSVSRGSTKTIGAVAVTIFVLVGLYSLWDLSNAVKAQGWPFTWPFIRRYMLGPLPDDRQKPIPRDHDAPLDQWNLRIQRFSPGGKLGDLQSLDRAVNTLRNECDLWWLTIASSERFLSDPVRRWYLRNHEEWFANQRLPTGASPCRLSMIQPHDFPAWAEDFPDYTANERSLAGDLGKLEGRYHAMISLHEIATSPWLLNSGTQKPPEQADAAKAEDLQHVGLSADPLFAACTDLDVFFSNKSHSWKNLIDHIDRGVRRFAQGGSTVESRLCDSWSLVKNTEGHPFPCNHEDRFEAIRSKLKSVKNIALAIAMDNCAAVCGGGVWKMNSGHLLFQPASHTSRFIAEAVLTLMRNIRLRHKFDQLDQGRLTYVLNQTFDLDIDALTWVSTYDQDDFNGVWGSAAKDPEHDEILMLGLFDIHAAFGHPLFRQAAERWEKRVSSSADASTSDTQEPMGVAVVFPRWMNSPACNHRWLELGRGKGRDARFFHCGDFVGHFNGCGKHRAYDKTFRRRIRKQCSNSSDWPMSTNDDGSLFDWDTWESEASNDEIGARHWQKFFTLIP